MYRYVQTTITLGAAVLFVLLGGMLTGQGKVLAESLDFDFTFTCDETVKVVSVGDTVKFYPMLTNTGSEADSYMVTLTENDPTPEEWWVRMCVGGICRDSTVDSVLIWSGEVPGPLQPGSTDSMELHVLPRTDAQGNYTMTVESGSSPGVKLTKSITFLLSAHEQVPVTDEWGLIILVALILTSGLYLMYRRYKLVRQT
jgi:hypothetical protein